MSESSMKSVLTKCLTSLNMDPVCIESPVTGLGIPDVNFKFGWFECKNLDAWPKGADENPVQFKHPLSKEQGVWLYRRAKIGGLAMVCAKVSTTWFFFDGLWIKDRWGKMTRQDMFLEADLYCEKGLNAIALRKLIHSRIPKI